MIDLHITIDEAIQFLVSCGLVIPTAELARLQTGEEKTAGKIAEGGDSPQDQDQAGSKIDEKRTIAVPRIGVEENP